MATHKASNSVAPSSYQSKASSRAKQSSTHQTGRRPKRLSTPSQKHISRELSNAHDDADMNEPSAANSSNDEYSSYNPSDTENDDLKRKKQKLSQSKEKVARKTAVVDHVSNQEGTIVPSRKQLTPMEVISLLSPTPEENRIEGKDVTNGAAILKTFGILAPTESMEPVPKKSRLMAKLAEPGEDTRSDSQFQEGQKLPLKDIATTHALIQRLENENATLKEEKQTLSKMLHREREQHEEDSFIFKMQLNNLQELLQVTVTRHVGIIAEKDREIMNRIQQCNTLTDQTFFKRREDFPPKYRSDNLDDQWKGSLEDVKNSLKLQNKDVAAKNLQFNLSGFPNIGKKWMELISGVDEKDLSFQELPSCFQNDQGERPSDDAIWQALSVAAILWHIFSCKGLAGENGSRKDTELWSIIAMQGGLEAVRTYDLMSTQARMRCPYYNDTEVPRTANQIAELCQVSFGMLFQHEAKLSPWIARLLKIRDDFLISKECLKLFFIPPGSVLDEKYMRAEKLNGFDAELQSPGNYRVKLCRWPGVMGFSESRFSDKYEKGRDIKDAFLASKDFFPEEPGKYKGWGDIDHVLSKAIVLVERIQE